MTVNNVAFIIPVYNEAEVIAETIAGISEEYAVICVDDGSRDGSGNIIAETRAILVSHPINMGQGAALQTGIEYALQFPQFEYFVTFDADGQHDINDIEKMLKVIKKEKLDVVLGSRFLGESLNMKRSKYVLLKLAIKFTNSFSKVRLTDTHNGIRVLNREFAESLDIQMPDMAHASEIIDKIGRNDWKYIEVPVTIRYTDYSLAKGQSAFNSFNILFDVLLQRGKRK